MTVGELLQSGGIECVFYDRTYRLGLDLAGTVFDCDCPGCHERMLLLPLHRAGALRMAEPGTVLSHQCPAIRRRLVGVDGSGDKNSVACRRAVEL